MTDARGDVVTARTRQLVLVVDDDKFILELVRLLLTRFGYDTVLASNGLEALAVAGARQPDLALVDVTMPVMDGYAAVGELKRDPATKSMPVILMTASVDAAAIARGFEAGADDYVTKPFNPRDLQSRVAAVLERATESAAEAAHSGFQLTPSA